jgi:hypothetical protein
MANVAGKWKIERSKDLEEYMKAIGKKNFSPPRFS